MMVEAPQLGKEVIRPSIGKPHQTKALTRSVPPLPCSSSALFIKTEGKSHLKLLWLATPRGA